MKSFILKDVHHPQAVLSCAESFPATNVRTRNNTEKNHVCLPAKTLGGTMFAYKGRRQEHSSIDVQVLVEGVTKHSITLHEAMISHFS